MIVNEFQPIDQRCTGCGNIISQAPILEVPPVNICRIYLYPEAKWSAGNCILATHLKKAAAEAKKELDPIKASKRSMKAK